MLGGQQPADRELIKSWMRRDWAENLYPGASNAEGRKELEEHLDAMLDLESGPPLIELNGRLIEESQKTLARLSVAQRAYALLKSQARTATAGDWVAAQKGGPDATRVFEAAGDPTLESVRVPEFFTYIGFQHDFIERLGDIADRIKRDRWVLGAAGEQAALCRAIRQSARRPAGPLHHGLHDRLAGCVEQAAAAQDDRRQAAIHRAERDIGADLAAQAADRIDSR